VAEATNGTLNCARRPIGVESPNKWVFVYVEYLSPDDADGLPFHEVWKYSAAGAAKICGFLPVRFRATDIHSP
jgi:hypothetical protein